MDDGRPPDGGVAVKPSIPLALGDRPAFEAMYVCVCHPCRNEQFAPPPHRNFLSAEPRSCLPLPPFVCHAAGLRTNKSPLSGGPNSDPAEMIAVWKLFKFQVVGDMNGLAPAVGCLLTSRPAPLARASFLFSGTKTLVSVTASLHRHRLSSPPPKFSFWHVCPEFAPEPCLNRDDGLRGGVFHVLRVRGLGGWVLFPGFDLAEPKSQGRLAPRRVGSLQISASNEARKFGLSKKKKKKTRRGEDS